MPVDDTTTTTNTTNTQYGGTRVSANPASSLGDPTTPKPEPSYLGTAHLVIGRQSTPTQQSTSRSALQIVCTEDSFKNLTETPGCVDATMAIFDIDSAVRRRTQYGSHYPTANLEEVVETGVDKYNESLSASAFHLTCGPSYQSGSKTRSVQSVCDVGRKNTHEHHQALRAAQEANTTNPA